MTDQLELSPRADALVLHWRALCKLGSMPLLPDYLDDPYIPAQPWTLILDADGPGSSTIRFLGTALVDIFGPDDTGKNFLDVVSPAALPHFVKAHVEVPRIPCGLIHVSECRTATGAALCISAVCLPLLRQSGGRCVLWFLDPPRTVGHGETGVQVLRVTAERWIDLGHGRPD